MGKRLDEARRMRPFILKGVQSLPDDEALEIKTIYEHWQTETIYTVGIKAQYGDKLYKCLQEHVSHEEWNPVAAVSLWAEVLIPDPEVIPEWEQPDSTNTYKKGDKVTHNGKTWISDYDNNSWEPGVYGWTEVTE